MSVSAYANIIGRNAKPFNPLLGETFEIVTDDFKFIGEHVSNKPPISAFYYEGGGYK